MKIYNLILYTIVIGLAVSKQAVLAQDLAQSHIEEVTVTAQKRKENVQDVPIAINAYSGKRLADSGIENTIDLQLIEPSLVFTTNAAFGQPYLRGVGSDLFTPGAESSIATFVDDVYQSRTVSALQDFFDVERVDVVKGPQGVLFGRNAVGGAISVYSKKPTDKLEGYLALTLGDFRKQRTEAALNVPLADNVFWRIAGLTSERDGYTDNVFTGGDVDSDDTQAFRTHLAVDVNDSFYFLLSGNYSSEDSSRSLANRVDTASGLAIADSFDAIRPSDTSDVALNEDTNIDFESSGVSLTANWDFGSVLLKSISSYRETDLSIVLDLDGSQLDFASNSPTQDSDTFTQEFHLVSQNDSALQWLLGLYYLDENASQQLNVALTFPEGIPNVPSDLLDQPGGEVKTTSYGLFGNVEYQFSEQWSLSAGLRYNRDERELDFLETVSTLSTGETTALIPLQLEDDYDAYTPRAVLEYTPIDDILLYASASRGYKAGGFNTNVFQPEGFNEETLWAYEAGLKSTFADGRVRINTALFHYDYSDLQLNTIPPGSPVGTFQIVINAAEATITGWELDAVFVPTDSFEINLGFQLLDAEFDDFTALNPNDTDTGEINRAGQRLPRAPEVSINLGAQYTWLVNERELILRGDYRYESEQFLDIFQDNAVRRDSNNVLNARLDYQMTDNVSLSLWGRNLTDEEIVQSSLRVDGLFGTLQFLSPPRTYGGAIRVSF